MTLAPIAGLSSLFCFDLFYKKAKTKKKKVLFIILFVSSIAVLLLAASRGAIGATAFALLFYLLQQNKKKTFKSFFTIAVLCAFSYLLYVFNPGDVFDSITQKMEARSDSGDLTAGRETMWKDRLIDFSNNPLCGVGFSTMEEIRNSRVNLITGTFEPGSGWLLILSSMGILGMFFFWKSAVSPLFFVWKHCLQYALPASMVILFLIHNFIEGYVIAFGNPLCALMWLSIALVNDSKKAFK